MSLKHRGRGMKGKKITKPALGAAFERRTAGKGPTRRTNNDEQSQENEEIGTSDDESKFAFV